MSYTMPINELSDTRRVRQMCIGNADPIFISDDDGNAQMVLLDAAVFQELYGKLQVYKKLAEAEEDVSTGRVCDAYDVLNDVMPVGLEAIDKMSVREKFETMNHILSSLSQSDDFIPAWHDAELAKTSDSVARGQERPIPRTLAKEILRSI